MRVVLFLTRDIREKTKDGLGNTTTSTRHRKGHAQMGKTVIKISASTNILVPVFWLKHSFSITNMEKHRIPGTGIDWIPVQKFD